MVCKKLTIPILGICALISGLWSLQKSHDLHMAKQRNLSEKERRQVVVEKVSLEEAKFQKQIKRYECLSGALILLSLISFLLSPLLGNGVPRRVK